MPNDPELSTSEKEMVRRFRALRGRDETPDSFSHFTTRGPFANIPVARQAEILAGSPMTPDEQIKFNQSVSEANEERAANPSSKSALDPTR